MKRAEWLKAKRLATEERYDRLWAPIYDDNWGASIGLLHQSMLINILNSLPQDATILDAACGTGKYWPILLDSGREFCGIDQSGKMLDRAHKKYPQVTIEKIGLQEMRYESAFDLVICLDAMEMVFPEDWPVVLDNFYTALKPAGEVYFTVEIGDPAEIEQDYLNARDKGLPVVRGESVAFTGPGDSEGGYHYYPSMEKVRQWLESARYSIKEEAEAEDYHHFWVGKV